MVGGKIGRVGRGHEVRNMIRGGQDISMTNTMSPQYQRQWVKTDTVIGGITTVEMIAEASGETEEIGATIDIMINGTVDRGIMAIGMEVRMEANTGEVEVVEEADSTSSRLQCRSTRVITGPDGVRSA